MTFFMIYVARRRLLNSKVLGFKVSSLGFVAVWCSNRTCSCVLRHYLVCIKKRSKSLREQIVTMQQICNSRIKYAFLIVLSKYSQQKSNMVNKKLRKNTDNHEKQILKANSKCFLPCLDHI